MTEDEIAERFQMLEDDMYCLSEDFNKFKNDTTKQINSLKQNGGNQDIGTLYTLEHDLEVKVANISNTVNELDALVRHINSVIKVEDTVPFIIKDDYTVIALPSRCIKPAKFWLDNCGGKDLPEDRKLKALKENFGAQEFKTVE